MMSNTLHRARAQALPNTRAGRQQYPREADRGPIFVIELQARPSADGFRSLRQILKRLLRGHHLRCVALREEQQP
jgi:hypothetical protein